MASGFPISKVAGSREAMRSACVGTVRHSGTYNAAPLSLATATATATMALIARDDAQTHSTLESLGARLQGGMESVAAQRSLPLRINRVGPVSQMLWDATGNCRSYESYQTSDRETAAKVAEAMADCGVYAAPRGLMFLGGRHGDDDVDRISTAFDQAVAISV